MLNKNENQVKKKKLSFGVIALSYILFITVWSLKVYFMNTDGLGELLDWAIGFLVHVIWWPGFALLFIWKYSDSLNISLKEMLSGRPKLKILIPGLLVALIYNLIAYIVNKDSFGTSMPIYDLVITVLTVGFFEEIVFRGWFLNAISVYTSERMANIISAVLFSFIHFPGWIKKGYAIVPMLVTGLSLFVLGLFFGYLFRKSRVVWTSAIVHSVWDMLSWIL